MKSNFRKAFFVTPAIALLVVLLLMVAVISGWTINPNANVRLSPQTDRQTEAATSINQTDSQQVLYIPLVFAPNTENQEPPTLIILKPKDRETITLPAEIHYMVTGFQVGEQTGGHMNAFVGDPESSFQIEIPLETQSGIAILPDDKRLPGKKDLTFQLAQADNQLLPNPEAKVTIKELAIEGRR